MSVAMLVTSRDDETVFEWWCGPRKLSAYVTGERTELLRVWGADIVNEMTSVIDPCADDVATATRWLLGGP